MILLHKKFIKCVFWVLSTEYHRILHRTVGLIHLIHLSCKKLADFIHWLIDFFMFTNKFVGKDVKIKQNIYQNKINLSL